MQVKNPVERCKACIAEAAKDLKEKAQKVYEFRRNSDSEQSHKDAPYFHEQTNSKSDCATSHRLSSDQENSRERHRTRSSDQEAWEDNLRMSSPRYRTLPYCPSVWERMSTIEYRPMPIPDPHTSDLPDLPSKLHWRYCAYKTKKVPRNIPSRTAQIKTTCVPQLEWTTADCRDWISVYLQEMFSYTRNCATYKASRSPETGEGIYHVSLWHWKDRVGCEAGQSIFYQLQQCREAGMVKSFNHEQFWRADSIPLRYEWLERDDVLRQDSLSGSVFMDREDIQSMDATVRYT
ncbi:hypothetical protein BKA65DRAFT_260046 [Rhexocercosporidium sp. MPI-PUGE-AT-0058]|nr:hypothetical protein BKA65DRAFT_260046 [Rhexocercosporidium sp. MPI-PUGE-AT-0058]